MGRAALIIVLGFGVTLAIMSRAITGRLSDAVENSTGYYQKTRAKNIASSAAEIYLRKMRQGEIGNGNGTYSMSSIMGGSVTIKVDSTVDKSPATLPDTALMTTIATYQGVKDSAVILVAQNLSITEPSITGALSVSNGGKVGLKTSNSTTIDGLNYDINGNRDSLSCADEHGLVYSTYGDVSYTTSGTLKIKGVDAFTPDTVVVAGLPNYTPMAIQMESVADIKFLNGTSISVPETLGTLASPKITYCQGSVSFSQKVTGAGILICDGKFNATNTFEFTGVIFFLDSGKVESKMSNADKIVGAVISAGTNVKLNFTNTTYIKYSCAAIDMAFKLPNLIGKVIVCNWWE